MNLIQPNHIISNNLLKWKIFDKFDFNTFNNDVQILTKSQLQIITQLRTAHLPLNRCMHTLQHSKCYHQQMDDHGLIIRYLHRNDLCCKKYNSGRCICGSNQMETIQHYVMECHLYNKLRLGLYCECMYGFESMSIIIWIKTANDPNVNVTIT